MRVIDLHFFLKCAVELFDSEAHRRRIHLRTDFTAARHYVKADPTGSSRSFGNLLKNSIKFTAEEGHIWVVTRDEGAHVSIEFRDDGAGWSPTCSSGFRALCPGETDGRQQQWRLGWDWPSHDR